MVVRGTKKFLDRVGRPAATDAVSTGRLGDWYANPWFWRPQVALFVNERSLLPVLLRLAPARTVAARLPAAFAAIAARIGIDDEALEGELGHMCDHVLAKTASRSVLGVMNEFAFLADHHCAGGRPFDLVEVSLWLAQVPCSPLYKTSTSPDRQLRALLR